MTTDLKIELFGKDLFDALWKRHGHQVTGLSLSRRHRKSEFTENIFRAVRVRLSMCHPTYEALAQEVHGEFVGNCGDFFEAVVTYFPHYVTPIPDPCPEMVMDSFLYSCAFVAHLCMLCHYHGDDFLDFGHEVWSMFTDFHLKDLFYSSGGWKKLHEFTDQDVVVSDFVTKFSTEVDSRMGSNFMVHFPHLTSAAVESFDSFQEWKGVDPEAPLALKWVDFCVHMPFMRLTTDFSLYEVTDLYVFQKLESTIADLRYILSPNKQGNYLNNSYAAARTVDSPEKKTHATDLLEKSPSNSKPLDCSTAEEEASSFPMVPISHFDTGHTEEIRVEQTVEFDREVTDLLKSNHPICSTIDQYPSSFPIRHFDIEGIGGDFIVFDGDVSPGTDPKNLLELWNPVKIRGADSKAKEALNIDKSNDDCRNISALDGNRDISTQSNTYNKNECLIQETDNVKDLEESSVEVGSGFYSLGIVLTPNNQIGFSETDNTNGTLPKPNINPNEFDSLMDQLGLDRCATFNPPHSKRRVTVYMKTTDLDDSAASNDIVEESPKHSETLLKPSLVSPNVSALSPNRKSPPTSPDVSVLSPKRISTTTSPDVIVLSHRRQSPPTSPNVPAFRNRPQSPSSPNVHVRNRRKQPPTSPISILKNSEKSPPNTNVLSNTRKSPLTSPNMNVLGNTRKSPLTSPNLNVLGNTRKSPLTSPNMNVLGNTRKSPLSSPNLNVLGNTRKSPLTSPNMNVLGNTRKSPLTSPNMNVLGNTRKSPLTSPGLTGLNRRSSAGKENSPSTKSKAEIKKSPHQKHVTFSLDSSKETASQKFKGLKENISPIKDTFCPSHLYLDIEDPSKDEKIPLPDDEKITKPTIEPSNRDKDVNKEKISSLKCPSKSTDSIASVNLPHRHSILDNDDENEKILESSLKQLDQTEKNKMFIPPKDIVPEPMTLKASQDCSSTDKRQITEDQKSSKPLEIFESTDKDDQSKRPSEKKDSEVQSTSAESTTANQFEGTSGVDDEPKELKTHLKDVKTLQKGHEVPSEGSTSKIPFDEDEEKLRKELNSVNFNQKALQTTESENAFVVPASENQLGISPEPQDAEKKGRKKKPKKRISRLQERIRDEGDAIKDVLRLIFVMGHRPGLLSVAAALQDTKNLLSKDEKNEK